MGSIALGLLVLTILLCNQYWSYSQTTYHFINAFFLCSKYGRERKREESKLGFSSKMVVIFRITEINYLVIDLFYYSLRLLSQLYLWHQVSWLRLFALVQAFGRKKPCFLSSVLHSIPASLFSCL